MESIFFIIPAIITFIFGGFWVFSNFKDDLNYEGCPTFGTIFLTLGWLIVIFVPILNWVSAIGSLVITYSENEHAIDAFFDKPIFRKKK